MLYECMLDDSLNMCNHVAYLRYPMKFEKSWIRSLSLSWFSGGYERVIEEVRLCLDQFINVVGKGIYMVMFGNY